MVYRSEPESREVPQRPLLLLLQRTPTTMPRANARAISIMEPDPTPLLGEPHHQLRNPMRSLREALALSQASERTETAEESEFEAEE